MGFRTWTGKLFGRMKEEVDRGWELDAGMEYKGQSQWAEESGHRGMYWDAAGGEKTRSGGTGPGGTGRRKLNGIDLLKPCFVMLFHVFRRSSCLTCNYNTIRYYSNHLIASFNLSYTHYAFLIGSTYTALAHLNMHTKV